MPDDTSLQNADKIKKESKLNYSAIVSMGCNPGDVSVWVKVGINEIWKKKIILINYLKRVLLKWRMN